MIKILAMDVDGTLTDGKIYMGPNGEACKAFSAKDGSGIHDLLIPAGIVPIIITGRTSEIVENRCRELDITELHQAVQNKDGKLTEIMLKYASAYSDVAYIGDDINDLPVMKSVKANAGIVGCPADAANEVKEIANFISKHNGGNGAVREFIEWLLSGDGEINK